MDKVVRYRDDEYDVALKVKTASIAMGVKRSALLQAQHMILREMDPLETVDGVDRVRPEIFPEWTLRTITYPACVAGTTAVRFGENSKTFDHTKMTVEEFMELPERLVVEWQRNILELNPHWEPAYYRDEEEEVAAGEDEPPASSN